MGRASFLAMLLPLSAAWATPAITGLYRAGELGIVDMQTVEGRIVARYRGGGSCKFKPEIQVLTGNFEGSVFLGTVFICQEGPSCDREKTFPFFAVFHDGALAGDVKLDVGCTSPGLEQRRLNISVASSEDRLIIAREGDSSASSVAGKKENKKELEKMAHDAYVDAQLLMKESKFAQARSALERSITYDDSDWKPYMFLGQVELKLNNVAKGLESFQKAVKIAPTAKNRLSDEDAADLFYNLACAYSRLGKKREAVINLRHAFGVGDIASLLESASSDPDLDLIRDEADFRRVMADAKVNKDKPRRR